jgi:hypothetical protein
MALTNEFPVISSNLKAGFGVYGTADPAGTTGLFGSTNGARNAVGAVHFIPAPSQGGQGYGSGSLAILPTGVGYASGLWVKYVLYKSTANPALLAAPGPVYYTDETFTTVSGAPAEAFVASNPTYSAGFLLPNTGSVAGVGVGSAISATILNNGGLGSYVWIGVCGFVPSASVGAVTQGNPFMAGTVAFTPILTTTILRTMGWVWGAVTSSIADVVLTGLQF